MDGKKLVELVIVSDDEDEDNTFHTECEYSGILDDDINVMLKCYIKIAAIPDPAENLLSYSCVHKWQQQEEQLLALLLKYRSSISTSL